MKLNEHKDSKKYKTSERNISKGTPVMKQVLLKSPWKAKQNSYDEKYQGKIEQSVLMQVASTPQSEKPYPVPGKENYKRKTTKYPKGCIINRTY